MSALCMWHVQQWECAGPMVGDMAPDAEWWVVAPDEALALEVVLEHEADPSDKFAFMRLADDHVLTVTEGDGDLLPAPPAALRERDGEATRTTAPVRAWLSMFSLPGVLGCTAWGTP